MANHDYMFTTDGKPLEVPPDVFAPAHTPGPWTRQRIGHLQRISGPRDAWVCNLFRDIHTPGSIQWEEVEANARLIAAAPELYDALVELVLWCSEPGDYRQKCIDAALAAIAKAEGQAQ